MKKWSIDRLVDYNVRCCITCLSFKYYKDESGSIDCSKGFCSTKTARNYLDVTDIEKMLEQEYLKGSNCTKWKGENLNERDNL